MLTEPACVAALGSGAQSGKGPELHLYGRIQKKPHDSAELVIMEYLNAKIKGLRGPRLEETEPQVT